LKQVWQLSIYVLLAAGVLSYPVYAAEAPKTDDQKFSYVMGAQIGKQFKEQGLTIIDPDAFSQAMGDVLNGRELALSDREMQEILTAKQQQYQNERMAQAQKAKLEGDQFLLKNKSKPGVVTLDNGLQYRVIEAGSGVKPTASNSVVAHYSGTLVNGTEFDSSYKRGQPATFPVNGVIQGWQQILPMMATGSTWEVFIPSNLAYGERGAGGSIGPNETLIFKIELIEVK